MIKEEIPLDSIERYLPPLEQEMQRVVSPSAVSPNLIYNMLHYHLGWVDADFKPSVSDGGKHLRPLLLLLTTEAQGGAWRHALPAAASIELLHNFTLIHDDIEDRDTRRRGRATLWSVWGVPQAINAGDALFTLAYQALINLRTQNPSLPAERVMQALQSYTYATLLITEGQCRDIAFETQQEVAESDYLSMIAGKTAALIGLASELGGIIAGVSEKRCDHLRNFGCALGKAFQMQDDLLGLWGNPERTGKPVGSDILKHKKTLPIIHGTQHSHQLRSLLNEPVLSNEDVTHALSLLEAVGSREYTVAQAKRYHREALTSLEKSGGEGKTQATIRHLVNSLLEREK
jgi:geranylgeranyl diphosphate synthase type I